MINNEEVLNSFINNSLEHCSIVRHTVVSCYHEYVLYYVPYNVYREFASDPAAGLGYARVLVSSIRSFLYVTAQVQPPVHVTYQLSVLKAAALHQAL